MTSENDALINENAKEEYNEKVQQKQYEESLKEKKAEKDKDKYITEVELSLCESLGRKVSIKGSEKGGSITIEFFNKEDLEKLAKLFED